MTNRHKDYPRGEFKGREIDSCASCSMEDPEGYWEVDRRPPYNIPEEETHTYICNVCYCTHAAAPHLYPGQNAGINTAITIIAQCTNMILRKLEEIHETLRRTDQS